MEKMTGSLTKNSVELNTKRKLGMTKNLRNMKGENNETAKTENTKIIVKYHYSASFLPCKDVANHHNHGTGAECDAVDEAERDAEDELKAEGDAETEAEDDTDDETESDTDEAEGTLTMKFKMILMIKLKVTLKLKMKVTLTMKLKVTKVMKLKVK